MIHFYDGKKSEAYPYFTGTLCTIYDEPPNISGFSFEGLDCADFCTLYRQGDGYYQLSNDGSICRNEEEEVPSLELIQQIEQEIEEAVLLENIQKGLKEAEGALAATDYIIIKAAEGCDMSGYDMEQIRKERQELRNSINALRAKGRKRSTKGESI